MTEPFIQHSGLVAPLDQINVDTDQIIPKQFLKRVERTGFGQFLFYDWRFKNDGSPNPHFVLNQDQYQNSTILVTGKNFVCGSSREHAPWALQDYGFLDIIAPSFADIFYIYCFINGLLPVVLDTDTVLQILNEASGCQDYILSVDLEKQIVMLPDKSSHNFQIAPFQKTFILKGLDEIGWTLQYEQQIVDYERSQAPK